MRPLRAKTIVVLAAILPHLAALAAGEVRVQDLAKLQGQRTNKLFGFGLVIGLSGTGDGASSPATLRALMKLHERYHAPVLDVNELKNNKNVALVGVEAVIPEFGAREGQALDVFVSALGPAASLKGGQLLTTPLQESTLTIQTPLALASGRIDLPEKENLRRGIVRGGAVLEEDFFYNFIDEGAVTLVLNDAAAGYPWAEVLAKAINIELQNPAEALEFGGGRGERVVVAGQQPASVVGAKYVRVQIPEYERADPADFISRVLQAQVLVAPHQPARVVINRTTRNVSFSGSVTVAPTVVHLNGLGAVAIGEPPVPASQPASGEPPTQEAVQFQELLTMLTRLQVSAAEMVGVVEDLYRSGALRAQLVYIE